MNIQLKRYIDPIVSFWKKLTKKKKVIILSSFAGVILVAVIIEIILSRPSYTVLYPNLSGDEVTDVCNQLKSMNVDYKVNGSTISIPKDKENTTRMELANEGYPKSSLNYDFFTGNVNAMTTDSERKIIEKYQLNQRLESVVKTFDSIQNANVTINIPDGNAYAWDSSSSSSSGSSASVTVTLANGKTLSASQVNGIKQLVSKSVPNLSTDNVAVIDTATGNELSGDSDSSETAVNISEFKRTIEKEYEDDVAANALKVLKPVFGDGNVQVTAKSVMDVDKKVSEILTYIPSTDNKGVVSQSTSDQETEKGTGSTGTASAVGAQSNTETSSNSDTATSYSGVTVNGDTIYTKDQQTYNYLVSQTKEQIQGDAANLKDMTISVVVNQETMDDTQKAEISKLVAYAAAIDPSKVTVYSSLFANQSSVNTTTKASSQTPNLLYIAIGAGLIGLLLIAMVILWIVSASRKRKLNRLLTQNMAMNAVKAPTAASTASSVGISQAGSAENSAENQPENAADVPADSADKAKKRSKAAKRSINPDLIDMSNANEENEQTASERKKLEALHEAQQNREKELRQDLQEFASQNPEIVAQLIRSWLRGDDNNG